MKHLLTSFTLLIFIIFSSCSNSNDDNQTTSQNTSSLEGVWKLQNIQTGSKLTFEGQNWKLESGTVTITGTFTLSGNTMNAVAVNRSGANNAGLQPNTFTGNIAIAGNKVTFTNFSGNWYAVFSTWYQKQ
jgi:hypothetical protein